MSKTLTKLVDEAIVPSLTLVLSKIGGMFLAVTIFGLEYDINNIENGKIIPYEISFKSLNDLFTVNTFSNLLMLIVPVIGFNIVLYKINHFQDTRLTPQKIIQIADKDRLASIESSKSIYTKAIVWIAFLWIAVILTTINVAKAESHIWTAVIAVGLGIISTLILVKNLEIDYTGKKQK